MPRVWGEGLGFRELKAYALRSKVESPLSR